MNAKALKESQLTEQTNSLQQRRSIWQKKKEFKKGNQPVIYSVWLGFLITQINRSFPFLYQNKIQKNVDTMIQILLVCVNECQLILLCVCSGHSR